MNIIERPTMTSLWHAACESMLFAREDELDASTGSTTARWGNVLKADSMEFDFDVSRDLWLTKARFPKLQRDYLDPDEVQPFLDRCAEISNRLPRRGIVTQMHCRPARQKDGKAQHTWGNCMLAITYRGGGGFKQPTFTLHSRATYISYLGGIDMALIWVLAKHVAEMTNCAVEEMAFEWHLDSMQWQNVRGVPYVMSQGLVPEVMASSRRHLEGYKRPTAHNTARALRGLYKNASEGVDPLTLKFGPVKRMNQRFQAVVNDRIERPSIPIDTLTLLPEMLR